MSTLGKLHVVQKNLKGLGGWVSKKVALKHLRKALDAATEDDMIGWMTPDMWIDTSQMSTEELWEEANS